MKTRVGAGGEDCPVGIEVGASLIDGSLGVEEDYVGRSGVEEQVGDCGASCPSAPMKASRSGPAVTPSIVKSSLTYIPCITPACAACARCATLTPLAGTSFRLADSCKHSKARQRRE